MAYIYNPVTFSQVTRETNIEVYIAIIILSTTMIAVEILKTIAELEFF